MKRYPLPRFSRLFDGLTIRLFESKSSKEEKQILAITKNELMQPIKKLEEIEQLIFDCIGKTFYHFEEIKSNTLDTHESFLVENLDMARIIRKLVITGNYHAGTVLLRANYERLLRILYCLKINKLDFINRLIIYPMPISFTKMESELNLTLYSELSKISHSNFEKHLMPVVGINNEGKTDQLHYLKKTTRYYDFKVAKKLIELNTLILTKPFLEYYAYLNKNKLIYELHELQTNTLTPPRILDDMKTLYKNLVKIEENMPKRNVKE